MGRKSGKEMRRLILTVSVSVLVLVLAIVAYFMADVAITMNNNIEHNKERMIEESVRTLYDMSSRIDMSKVGPEMIQVFNPAIVQQIMTNDYQALYDYILKIVMFFYPVVYTGIVADKILVAYDEFGDIVIDPSQMPVTPPEAEYSTMDQLGNKEGFFVSVFIPINLSVMGFQNIYINLIVDRTQQLADIETYFKDQRNDLLLRLSLAAIIAIILSILLTTIGLRYFTRKYVVRPIEKLNRDAERIAEGTFEGEVEVDEESAYAALQGLLRSGQKVISQMDENLRE
jgi:HAMP domain-containing protein